MLSSSKAKEIAIIKEIDDMIMEAALKGNYTINVLDLSYDAKEILINNGYDVVTITNDWGKPIRYKIKWDN